MTQWHSEVTLSLIIENTFLFLGDQSTASVSVWLLSVSLLIRVDKYKSVLSVFCSVGLCLQYNHNIISQYYATNELRIAGLATVISLQADCTLLIVIGTLEHLLDWLAHIILISSPKKETKLNVLNWLYCLTSTYSTKMCHICIWMAAL